MGKSEKNIMKENEEMKPVHIQCRKKRKEKSVCCCYCSHVAVPPPSPSHVAQIKAHSSRNPKYPRPDSLSKEKKKREKMP